VVIWKTVSNWAKNRPATLRLADRLGRGRGRMRVLDHVKSPRRANFRPDLRGWENHELAAIWIGHATMLLRVGGMTILTDPVFSNRIGVGMGLMTAGPMRCVAPALKIKELPAVDLIVVSHAHFDHLDIPTLARLGKHVPVITSDRNSDLLRQAGFDRITELRWGEFSKMNGLKVTACEVRHWGARTFYDQHRGFAGFVFESGKRRVLFGGDTAYHEKFRSIGKVDLAILGIGAYNPFVYMHATPEQAYEMANHVRADHMIPMHHSTFRLSREPMNEPMQRLMERAGKDPHRIVIREVGGMWRG
jgi:L-ascorbate metabolism protein UlaG (beta-lactamase superfamily)